MKINTIKTIKTNGLIPDNYPNIIPINIPNKIPDNYPNKLPLQLPGYKGNESEPEEGMIKRSFKFFSKLFSKK